MNPMNPLATRIQWINLNPDSWDSSLLRFFGKGFEKIHVASDLRAKIVALEKSVFGFFVSFAEKNPRLISFRCFFGKKESV